ncbi:SCO4402 family protein [Streptomyces sp. NPDC054962]
MEQPDVMMSGVEFPDVRLNVVSVLESLADTGHQHRVWLDRGPAPDDAVDNLDLVVHVLFDDSRVLEDPEETVGEVLRSRDEARAARALAEVLGPLVDELGDVGDEVYLASPRWPAVVTAARDVLDAMRADDR